MFYPAWRTSDPGRRADFEGVNLRSLDMEKPSIGKTGIESLGIRSSDPGKNIVLVGKDFGDLILLEHTRSENLQRCAWILEVVARSGADESALLAKVSETLKAMGADTAAVVQDFLRVAREQGLRFEIVPAPGDLH